MDFYRWITSNTLFARILKKMPGIRSIPSRLIWEIYGLMSPQSAVAHNAVSGDENWEIRTQRDVRAVLKVLHDPQDSRVVDIACGVGRVSNGIAELGANVIAADISRAMLSHGKKMYPNLRIHWHHISQSGNLSFCESDSVDLVMCWYAFQHMEREEVILYLIEAYRILKKGGFVVAEFPLLSNEAHQKMYLTFVKRGYPWSHARMRWYTKEELFLIFKMVGFSEIKIEGEDESIVYAQK